jgi:hypothetical protein
MKGFSAERQQREDHSDMEDPVSLPKYITKLFAFTYFAFFVLQKPDEYVWFD